MATVGTKLQGFSWVLTVPETIATMVPFPVVAVPETVAGPSGLMPLLRRGVTPVFMVLRFAHCTFIPPCFFAAGEVPSAVNTNAVCRERAPGAGIFEIGRAACRERV